LLNDQICHYIGGWTFLFQRITEFRRSSSGEYQGKQNRLRDRTTAFEMAKSGIRDQQILSHAHQRLDHQRDLQEIGSQGKNRGRVYRGRACAAFKHQLGFGRGFRENEHAVSDLSQFAQRPEGQHGAAFH